NHIGGPASAREGYDQIGPAFRQHAGITGRASERALIFPIGLEGLDRDAAGILGPATGEVVSAARPAFDNEIYPSLGMELVQHGIDAMAVVVIAAATDKHPHAIASRSAAIRNAA